LQLNLPSFHPTTGNLRSLEFPASASLNALLILREAPAALRREEEALTAAAFPASPHLLVSKSCFSSSPRPLVRASSAANLHPPTRHDTRDSTRHCGTTLSTATARTATPPLPVSHSPTLPASKCPGGGASITKLKKPERKPYSETEYAAHFFHRHWRQSTYGFSHLLVTKDQLTLRHLDPAQKQLHAFTRNLAGKVDIIT